MRIIPAIDVIEGKCVRLTQGDYTSKKVYNQNPLEVAKEFEDNGMEYRNFLELDGAKIGEIVNYRILEQIATKTSLKVDYGGGLKTNEDLHIAFNSGAKQVTGGSVAVKNPKTFEGWVSKYGPQKIILGADTSEGKIAISGWQEQSEEELIPFIKNYMKKDLRYVICTDISKDGMLEGPAIDLYRKVLEECSYSSQDQSIRLIASGGISSMEDLYKLKEIGCEGAIIGKALYENKIDLRDLSRLL